MFSHFCMLLGLQCGTTIECERTAIHKYAHTRRHTNKQIGRSGILKQIQGTDEVCNLNIKHPDGNLFCGIKQLGDESGKRLRVQVAMENGSEAAVQPARFILDSKS